TWLKENQTRAVEFSRNNHSSRTSARTSVLSALPWKAFCFPAVVAARPLRCVFTLSGVPRPAKSAVCVNQIGVKPVLLFPV
ncbi:hypothetical protein, partial [Nocardiopsis ganjiahuensis]|uniref:hypothetical protein n=1 Tax=Nocardiopsis ganjiahuensis TaxID=239984 RepID=UPI0019553D3C